jgi:peptide/nickel transport system substrate-binding protein
VDAAVTIVQRTAQLGDPHVNTDGRDRLSLRWSVYEPLVRRDRDGAFVPALAARWTCAPDARTWTFHLREGVRFHSGHTLHADDVVASIRRMSDPEAGGEMATQGVYASYLHAATIEALDDHTLRIVTTEPMADLLDLLVDIAVIRAADCSGDAAGAPGTGPYRRHDENAGRVMLHAFENHWQSPPAYASVLWLAEPEPRQRVAMLLDGRADIATDIGPGGVESLDGKPETRVVVAHTSLCVAFLFNAVQGVCADRRVRQALNHALDVEAVIRDVTHGAATRLNGPLAPIHDGYNPDVPPYAYDPGRARELLAEAGQSDLRLVVDVPTSLPNEATALGQQLVEHYARVGVQVEVREFSDRPAYAHMVRAKQIGDACCFDSSPLSTWRVLREKIHSGVAGPWWQGYANSEVDRLLDEAASTVDPTARQGIYRCAYRLIRDDAPWLFLYTPLVHVGVSARLTGWEPGFNGLVLV